MTDQYTEEKRWVFSFDLKEGNASSSPSWVASSPEIRWVFSFDLKEGNASSSPSWVASSPEIRWVFSFDLKEGNASSSPSWVASSPEILDESSSSSSLSTLQCPVLSAYFL